MTTETEQASSHALPHRSRVVVVGGGTRDVDTIELWIVPQGAQPPRPTPR